MGDGGVLALGGRPDVESKEDSVSAGNVLLFLTRLLPLLTFSTGLGILLLAFFCSSFVERPMSTDGLAFNVPTICGK